MGPARMLWQRLMLVALASCLTLASGGEAAPAGEDSSRCPNIFQNAGLLRLSALQLQLLGNLTRPQRLRQLTDPLLATPRPVGSAGHAAARDHLVRYLGRLGWRVELDAFATETPIGRRRFTNVVATRPTPSGPAEEPRPVVLLAAHYDTAPHLDEAFVGATDSAVPCGILLMLAEALNSLKAFGNSIQVRIVFFDGEESLGGVWSEEDSLYGSRHLASRWLLEDGVNPGCPAITEVSDLVLLDLIGAPGQRIEYTELPGPARLIAKERMDFGRLAAVEQRLRATGQLPEAAGHPEPFFVPPSPGRSAPLDTVDDDHAPFRQLGVPALHLVPQTFPDVWHTPEDTGSRVQWGHSAAVARVLLTWLLETF